MNGGDRGIDREARSFLVGWLASSFDNAALDVELKQLAASDTDPVRVRATEILQAVRSSRGKVAS